MTRRIVGGWLDVHVIRTARKPRRCDYFRGLIDGKRTYCAHVIQPGEDCAEGEMNDTAGGWGRDCYCLGCAGPEAAASAAASRSVPRGSK